jgi:hypothetical protein
MPAFSKGRRKSARLPLTSGELDAAVQALTAPSLAAGVLATGGFKKTSHWRWWPACTFGLSAWRIAITILVQINNSSIAHDVLLLDAMFTIAYRKIIAPIAPPPLLRLARRNWRNQMAQYGWRNAINSRLCAHFK